MTALDLSDKYFDNYEYDYFFEDRYCNKCGGSLNFIFEYTKKFDTKTGQKIFNVILTCEEAKKFWDHGHYRKTGDYTKIFEPQIEDFKKDVKIFRIKQ